LSPAKKKIEKTKHYEMETTKVQLKEKIKEKDTLEREIKENLGIL
jgi:hypothetical protein